MKIIRWVIAMTKTLGLTKQLGLLVLAVYMTGIDRFALAQDTETSPFSITLAPVQYVNVNGNVGKFEALNWMPVGANAGVSDISFVKDINKNISVEADGSVFPKTDDNTGHLILKDGDLAFLKIDYSAFRKYYDNTGGVDSDSMSGHPSIPGAEQGAKLNSPDLQMDISFFKLEAGLGDITDPYLDVVYAHNSMNGDKSLLMWTPAYNSNNSAYRLIGPSYEQVNDTSDTVTLSEKKDIEGITIKGQQSAEIDYNNNLSYLPYLNSTMGTPSTFNEIRTEQESPDAKLFGSGVRFEKWMFNDNTFAGFGYHYNHTHSTDLMQNQQLQDNGIVLANYSSARQSFLSWSDSIENEHVFTGNLNTNLTPDLAFITDARYEHLGAEGYSSYLEEGPAAGAGGPPPNGSLFSTDNQNMDNHQDLEGEHVALRYSGISHTSLYAESDMEQSRNWLAQTYGSTHSPSSDFFIERLNRSQNESWTFGGRVVPNRFFTFSTQVQQRWEDNEYDTLAQVNPGQQTFLDSLMINSIEETSTLTWKPYHWIQNSLKYQYYDTDYMPREAAEGTGVSQYGISKNHMLTSQFTYDITVEPIDPILLMISYSHVENYVRTLQASEPGTDYIPTFNSGDNSWLFSASYTPTENLILTNTVAYIISPNYVDFTDGVPYGSSFNQLTISTSLQYTYHQWLKISPTYEYASYRGNSLVDDGNYSANIFELNLKFDW